MVTIKDVAKEAGVSIGAVSKVLHGRGGNIRVSEATAQRIKDAARTLAYRPNYHARSLRSGRSRSVGLVSGSWRELERRGLFHMHLVQRLVSKLHSRGYTLNLAPELMPLTDLHGLSDGRFDGLVWLPGTPSTALQPAFFSSPVPVVSLGGSFDTLPERGAVYTVDEEGSYELLLDHLVSLGHKAILYSDHPLSDEDALGVWRREGFVRAAEKRGLSIGIEEATSAEESLRVWRASAERATVIVASSDRRGAMILWQARLLGISAPEDVSIVAFDGSPSTIWSWPGLTTVRPPVDDLLDRATDHLIRQMERESSDPVMEQLPCTLDLAGSTGPAAIRA